MTSENRESEEIKELLISRLNLGKRASRERMSMITNKMRMKDGKSGNFAVKEGLGWNVGGCVRIMSGVMLLALISMIGEFTEESFNNKFDEMKRE